MTQRKILIITNRVPYPLRDGGNIAMNAMAEGYRKAGWQVYLLSMNTTRHYVSSDQLAKLYRDLYAFDAVPFDNRLKVKDIVKNFLFSDKPEHVKRFYGRGFKEKIKRVLQSFQPDVVQMESVFLTSYLPVIRKYSRAITVLRMHNVEYQIWQGLARRTRNPVKKLYLQSLAVRIRNYERKAWREYDLLLPITEKDSYLVKRLEEVDNMHVAPFSIDSSVIKPINTKERWVGYHIGAMDWLPNRDGVNWFIKTVWPTIHKVVPQFEFYFAGRNMPAEFKNLDVDGVHCMNEVPDADAFIADKKILIVPIRSGGGIRVKILEAMAAGKIVITTTTGIKGIEAKPNEHYLRAHKAEDFVKAVKWCMDNKAKAEELAENARKLILEKYDHDRIMQGIVARLDSMIARQQNA